MTNTVLTSLPLIAAPRSPINTQTKIIDLLKFANTVYRINLTSWKQEYKGVSWPFNKGVCP